MISRRCLPIWRHSLRSEMIETGRMSTFGGPRDTGVSPNEGLALWDQSDVPAHPNLFLPYQPPRTTGLARRLNPEAFYVAMRWNYEIHPRAWLRTIFVTLRANGLSVLARPADFGPNSDTGRIADLSPGAADFLGLSTDDIVEVEIPDVK